MKSESVQVKNNEELLQEERNKELREGQNII